MPDNTQKIDDIDEVLDVGIERSSLDGETTDFNHESLRRRRRELEAENTAAGHTRPKRPRFSRMITPDH